MKTIARYFTTLITIFLLSPVYIAGQEIYDQLYRPQFHFTPEQNQQTEPNGLVYYDGEYHLFYNYIINETDSLWGHAVSADLLHWEYLPAISPSTENAEGNEQCQIKTGSLIVDETNLLGKRSGTDKTFAAFYITPQCGLQIAFSADKGITWQEFKGNPVMSFNDSEEAKYPKVFWHEPTGKYVMVIGRKNGNEAVSDGISFYTSENLVDWNWESHTEGINGRFDFVELGISNVPDETKWVLFAGDGSYTIGQFDGKSFTPETSGLRSDWGYNYFAANTWNGIPEEDDRTLQIAWMRGGNYPGMPFDGQMTFPCELILEDSKNGYRLIKKPANEIALLHDKNYEWQDENLFPGLDKNLIKRVKGDCLHIIGEFDLMTCNNFGFMVRTDRNNPGTEIMYSVPRGVLTVLGTEVPLQPNDNKITLEILIDRTSIEVFANNGQAVVSNCFTPTDGANEIELFNRGGELFVENLEIYKLQSVWQE